MSDILSDTMTPLVRDLLEWLDRQPRTYAAVIDGWRTSCPRLPVWEEATDRRFVARRGAMSRSRRGAGPSSPVANADRRAGQPFSPPLC